MKGFTLLEVLISVAILAIVGTILISAFGSFRAAEDLREAHSNIIGLLKDARARTLSSDSNSGYGVHFETLRAVLFKGVAYSSSDPLNEIYNLPGSVQISTISLGGPVDTVFTRLLGTTTSSGTVILQSLRNSSTKVITIEPTGVVK